MQKVLIFQPNNYTLHTVLACSKLYPICHSKLNIELLYTCDKVNKSSLSSARTCFLNDNFKINVNKHSVFVFIFGFKHFKIYIYLHNSKKPHITHTISIIYIFICIYIGRFGRRKTEKKVIRYYLMKLENVATYSMKVGNGNDKDNRIQ